MSPESRVVERLVDLGVTAKDYTYFMPKNLKNQYKHNGNITDSLVYLFGMKPSSHRLTPGLEQQKKHWWSKPIWVSKAEEKPLYNITSYLAKLQFLPVPELQISAKSAAIQRIYFGLNKNTRNLINNLSDKTINSLDELLLNTQSYETYQRENYSTPTLTVTTRRII